MSRAALLVVGGDGPSRASMEARLKRFAFVCAADSGFDLARSWGVEPDLVVGDMDSVSDPASLSSCREVIVHPRDKDDTDTELGLAELRRRGFDRIAVAGGGGGRLDHLLAIRALFERPDGPDEWYTASELVVRLAEKGNFSAPRGSTVSVFPLSRGCSGMHSAGLKWPLDSLSWDAGAFGISNVTIGDAFSVDPGPNPILVVAPLEACRLEAD